uniref:DNA-directed RNA polymerase n=1 Tax=Rhizophora mucronata TaxID=61149 RepID=A0A2P2MCI4_RHIMU
MRYKYKMATLLFRYIISFVPMVCHFFGWWLVYQVVIFHYGRSLFQINEKCYYHLTCTYIWHSLNKNDFLV